VRPSTKAILATATALLALTACFWLHVRCLHRRPISLDNARLRSFFSGQTAVYAGFAGLKNGQLLSAAESVRFEVLLTADQGLEYQQNLDRICRPGTGLFLCYRMHFQ